jgi:hypothetical protein
MIITYFPTNKHKIIFKTHYPIVVVILGSKKCEEALKRRRSHLYNGGLRLKLWQWSVDKESDQTQPVIPQSVQSLLKFAKILPSLGLVLGLAFLAKNAWDSINGDESAASSGRKQRSGEEKAGVREG